LGQGLEHETPQVRAGMGQGQLRAGADLVAEGDEVEVQRAGLVEDALWAAAKFALEFLEAGKEGFGGLARAGPEPNDGVEEEG
jgi:hypothetical protein